MVKGNKGVVSYDLVKEAFRVYANNRERYFMKEFATVKEFVYYGNTVTEEEKIVRKKVRQTIQRYMIHKKMPLATPSLVERYYLQGSFKDLWSLTNKEWKIISKDDPHKNRSPITFNGDIEAGTDQKGETNPIDELWKKKKAKDYDVGCTNKCYKPCYSLNLERIRYAEMSNIDDFPIIWDSGASVSITHEKSDFIHFTHFTKESDLKGIQGFLGTDKQEVKGPGTVSWFVTDTTGAQREIKIKAYYIPKSQVRLLSVSTLLDVYPGEEIKIKIRGLILSGIKGI